MDELGKAGDMRTAEFGVRSAVAEDMPTGVKLLGETEKSASFVGDGNPAMRLCPFALLNSFWERWDIDAVWTYETDASMRRRLTPQDTDFNDCVHVYLSKDSAQVQSS